MAKRQEQLEGVAPFRKKRRGGMGQAAVVEKQRQESVKVECMPISCPSPGQGLCRGDWLPTALPMLPALLPMLRCLGVWPCRVCRRRCRLSTPAGVWGRKGVTHPQLGRSSA